MFYSIRYTNCPKCNRTSARIRCTYRKRKLSKRIFLCYYPECGFLKILDDYVAIRDIAKTEMERETIEDNRKVEEVRC